MQASGQCLDYFTSFTQQSMRTSYENNSVYKFKPDMMHLTILFKLIFNLCLLLNLTTSTSTVLNI